MHRTPSVALALALVCLGCGGPATEQTSQTGPETPPAGPSPTQEGPSSTAQTPAPAPSEAASASAPTETAVALPAPVTGRPKQEQCNAFHDTAMAASPREQKEKLHPKKMAETFRATGQRVRALKIDDPVLAPVATDFVRAFDEYAAVIEEAGRAIDARDQAAFRAAMTRGEPLVARMDAPIERMNQYCFAHNRPLERSRSAPP